MFFCLRKKKLDDATFGGRGHEIALFLGRIKVDANVWGILRNFADNSAALFGLVM